jgi:predicted metal-dependent phosphoesterase TrpH
MPLTVEFHCHTIFSKDSLTRPDAIVSTARRKGIDRVVVTDHNTTAGARAAYAIDPELIIVGEEIRTKHGELLAAFVTEEIPRWLPLPEAIRRLRDQGAFISIPHPLDAIRGWKMEDLLEIIPEVDAIEVFNARCITPVFNRRADEFARQHGLAPMAGSDAHTAFELGNAVVMLPQFTGPDELRAVIRQGVIRARLALPWAFFASNYARLRKRLEYNKK